MSDQLPSREEVLDRVVKRLKERRWLLRQTIAYVLFDVVMIFCWIATGGGYFWPIWIIVPWGFWLAIRGLVHYNRYYNRSGVKQFRKVDKVKQKEEWIGREVDKEIERLREQNSRK